MSHRLVVCIGPALPGVTARAVTGAVRVLRQACWHRLHRYVILELRDNATNYVITRHWHLLA